MAPTVPNVPRTLPLVVSTALQVALLDLMLLVWLAALVVAVWGAVTEAGRAERARRRELATGSEPGPVPGIDTLLDHWGLWAIGLGAAGVGLLAWVASLARSS